MNLPPAFLFAIIISVMHIPSPVLANPPISAEATSSPTPEPAWDSTEAHKWQPPFEKVSIPSSLDGAMQDGYIYKTTAEKPMPLIVSLHTWSGDYTQYDELSELVQKKNWNVIHPNFRGPNVTPESCGSKHVIQDIDDAIAYAIKNMPVDSKNIFIVGTSGGGHASCVMYLNTRHAIRATFAWVPISDIEAWYYQSLARKNKYANEIMSVTQSAGTLNAEDARKRSPLYMPIPKGKRDRIHLFAGISDGYNGSVPISHALSFYNRLAKFAGAKGSVVSDADIIALLARGKPSVPAPGTSLADREVLYHRESPIATITIFQGGHEMLVENCFSQIEKNVEGK